MAILRFSVFEIDTTSGELTRQGRRVAIAAQSFSVLHLLASRPHEVVTRLELRQALWSPDVHVDFDRGLNFCVAAVRRALGDDARRPRFVETIPGRGYRFIAEVRIVDPIPGQHESEVTGGAVRRQDPPPTRSRTTKTRTAAAAAMLTLMFQLPSAARVHSRETAAPAAMAAFQRGQDLWNRGPASWPQSLHEFEAAARIDGRFAEAHYALATTFVDLASRRMMPAASALPQAEQALRRALALEDVPATRLALGGVRLALDWDWDAARDEVTHAIDRAPGSDGVLLEYARLLSASGDDESALEVVRRAEALSPRCDKLAYESAVLHYRARHYDEALRRLEAIAESTEDLSVHDLAFLIHVQLQNWEAAQREVIALIGQYGARPEAIRSFAALSPKDAVKRFLDSSLVKSRPEAISGAQAPTRMALMATLGGHNEEALAWLERSLAERDVDLVFALRNPAFDALRRSPRFQAVEARVRKNHPASAGTKM